MLTHKIKLLGLVALLLQFVKPLVCEEYKLVYTIAGPRSLGTIFLRTFENRPDFIVYNEPLCPAHSSLFDQSLTNRLYHSYSPLNFEAFKAEIFEKLDHSHVMAKDVSFACYGFIKDDLKFLSDPRVHFVFLVRDPHQTAISFYSKQESTCGRIDEYRFHPDRFHKLLGYESLFHLYNLAKKHSPNPVTLIFASDLSHKTGETLQNLCSNLSIPHIPDTLQFTAYSSDFTGENWHELKKHKDHFLNWHGDALFSTSITPHTEYELDSEGKPTFSEIENPDHQKAVINAYQEALPYYHFFKAEMKKIRAHRDAPTE